MTNAQVALQAAAAQIPSTAKTMIGPDGQQISVTIDQMTTALATEYLGWLNRVDAIQTQAEEQQRHSDG
jgi:hypothetical protein